MNTASQTAAQVEAIPDIGETAGPLLLGAAFNAFLFGVLTMQMYMYASVFRKDHKKIKIVVCIVYMLDVLQTILVIVEAIQKFVIGLGNPLDLLLVHALWLSIPILTGLITFLCQGWYAYRIWSLATHIRNITMKVIFFVIVVICIVQLTMAVLIGIKMRNAGRLDIYFAMHGYKLRSGIWYASSALGDVLIAICMIFLLVQVKGPDNKNSFPTQRFLAKFVRLAVGTNSMTATLAILILILVFLPINPSYYEAILAILGKLYSNSMMVQLNNRMHISMDGKKLGVWKQSTPPFREPGDGGSDSWLARE